MSTSKKKQQKIKRGLSSAEMQEIRERAEAGELPEDIGKAIGRSTDVVIKAINRLMVTLVPVRTEAPIPVDQVVRPTVTGYAANRKNQILAALRTGANYHVLKNQLTPAELRFYESNYCDILEQFGDDVTATERVSLANVVMLMVQMARNAEDQLTARKEADRCANEAKRLEALYPDKSEDDDDDDVGFIRPEVYQKRIDDAYRGVAKAEQRLTTLSATYAQASKEQQSLFEDLKSTRNQRLDRATKPASIQDLLKELSNLDELDRQGRRAELMRRVMTSEAERLAQLHEYADGQLDQPYLTPETVIAVQSPSRKEEPVHEPETEAATEGTIPDPSDSPPG